MLHRQMQYFVAVVDCGSFTEAAEQNYISQSAISQQIQAIADFSPIYPEVSIGIMNGTHEELRVSIKDGETDIILMEQDFYESILGVGGNFIFAESLEEGRLMVIGNRGFMPIEIVGTLAPPSPTVKRLPLYRGNEKVKRNYCAFWPKDKTNHYIEEFAGILKGLLY